MLGWRSLYELCSGTNGGVKATVISVVGINLYVFVPLK